MKGHEGSIQTQTLRYETTVVHIRFILVDLVCIENIG